MKFIKVLEPKLQEELAGLGFSYTIEQIGEKQIYAFADCKELREHIAKNYSDTKNVCFFGDKLFF